MNERQLLDRLKSAKGGDALDLVDLLQSGKVEPYPQPAVPDALPLEPFTTVDKSSKNYRAGWNACRAAMLSAAKGEQ